MGELGLNKIFGALLAVALAVMGLREVSSIVFGGGHHGDHHYENLNEWAEASFHGYRIELADTGGGEVIEEIYDLGLLLASADAAKGERSFKAKCASCHTIEQGGANGTGPNLYDVIGAPKQHLAGFAYSGALANVGGDWSYENMDNWLRAPSSYARGTSMGFAGLNRDDERANVIAYLASYSPDAPAFPEPLPAIEEGGEAVEEGVAEELAGDEAATDTTVVEDTAGAVVEDATTVVEDAVETIEDAVTDTVEEITAPAETDGEN